MYRLLVVDDEAIIADGLHEVFQSLGHLELDVYKAYSGNAALDLLGRTRIDIVLTDIRMPGINGLQLLEKIHESWPKCKVIFLTGYDEFEYVYSAIQHEGVSYLLKTEGYGKVIQAVEKSISEIEKAMKVEEVLQKAKEQQDTTIALLQKEYFSGIIMGEFSKEEINQKQFDDLQIPLKAQSNAIMLLAGIDNLKKGISYSERTGLLYGIKLIAEHYFSSHALCVHFTERDSSLVWLFQPGGMTKTCQGNDDGHSWEKLVTFIKGNVELIQEACRKTMGIFLSFALDDAPFSWDEAPERFSRLKMILNYRIGKESGVLLTDKSMADKDLYPQDENGLGKLHLKRFVIEALENYLDHGLKSDFHKLLYETMSGLKEIKSIHYAQAQEIYYSIALVLFSYINKWNLTEKIAFRIGLYKLMQIDEHGTWENAIEYLRVLADIIFEIQDFEQEKRAQDAIKRIQKHINDNIHNPDELTLVRLADLIYFNPSYLSRLFKQVTGTNLSEYIWEARIKKAKALLEDGYYKIHKVAEAVGYESSTNFARFFKKITGITPQEYRDSILTGKQVKTK